MLLQEKISDRPNQVDQLFCRAFICLDRGRVLEIHSSRNEKRLLERKKRVIGNHFDLSCMQSCKESHTSFDSFSVTSKYIELSESMNFLILQLLSFKISFILVFTLRGNQTMEPHSSRTLVLDSLKNRTQ